MPTKHDVHVSVARIFLLDGPLMLAPERREALVARMATDLIHHDIADRDDARRLLHSLGYSAANIHCVLDDALQVAAQEILVAKEMLEP